MELEFHESTDAKASYIVVPVLKDRKEGEKVRALYQKWGIDAYLAKSGFTGETGATELFCNDNKKFLLYGLGEQVKLTHEKVRQAFGSLPKALQCRKVKEAAVLSIEGFYCDTIESIARAQTEGLLLGGYAFLQYKSKKKEDIPLTKMYILLVDNAKAKEWKNGYETGKAIAELMNHVKDWCNEPPNVMTPVEFAKRAKALGEKQKLGYKCLEPEQMQKEEMNCLLGVAQGSAHPSRLVVLEYMPKKGAPVNVIVGKGVCFDSGGISLKPSKGMEEMKFDMCGAAATAAILAAAARLQLPVNVVGVMPLVENLPGSSAQRPSDIIKAASGKFVEILNTDAEGRLILADALHYAKKYYKPAAIVDLATLTGACIIALGHACSGLMGNNDILLADIKKASEKSGEKVWQLPLYEEYFDDIKSQYADIKNIGAVDGAAGAITAAMFLKEFVDETPWAHLDIAGTAWTTLDGSDYARLGATGAGVRVVTQWLMDKK